ncbi:MAG: lipoate--protein ligase family protein [Isosphaeraceae bacterium]
MLRFWELPTFAVVLGATSRRLEDVNVELCREEGVPLARRSSGGGTVVIGPGALNLTVVLPMSAAPGLNAVDTAHSFVLGRIAASLSLSVPNVEVLGLGDLTLNGRKFGGSAQRRLRHWFFVHVSVLYNFPLARISRFTNLPRRQPAYREGRPHEDFVTNLPMSREELQRRVIAAWTESPGRVDDASLPTVLACELTSDRFGDPAWVERL